MRDKYRALYELSKELLFREHERFTRIEEKASNYLAAFTVLLPVAAYFAKWSVDNAVPPVTAFDWLMVVLAVAIVASVGWTWSTLFRVLRVTRYARMPLNRELVAFFRRHREVDVYHALAKGNVRAYEHNVRIAHEKLRYLVRAHKQVQLSMGLVIAFTVVYVVSRWIT